MPVMLAGMLGHSISMLLNTYAHFIPTMQDQAAPLMDDILTSIPIELEKNYRIMPYHLSLVSLDFALKIGYLS
jgi:hypothetical protein